MHKTTGNPSLLSNGSREVPDHVQKLKSHEFFCFKKTCNFLISRFPYCSYSLIHRRRVPTLMPNVFAASLIDGFILCACFTAAILNCLSYTARFIFLLATFYICS